MHWGQSKINFTRMVLIINIHILPTAAAATWTSSVGLPSSHIIITTCRCIVCVQAIALSLSCNFASFLSLTLTHSTINCNFPRLMIFQMKNYHVKMQFLLAFVIERKRVEIVFIHLRVHGNLFILFYCSLFSILQLMSIALGKMKRVFYNNQC